MALLMSTFISAFIAFVKVGFSSQFLSVFWEGFYLGMIISLPLSYILPPLIKKGLHAVGIKHHD